MDSSNLLTQFETLKISASDFHHNDHIEVAYEMLNKYEFVDATSRYASGIRAMAEKVGVPEKYNTTITLAFMSLVAERKSQPNHTDLKSFLVANVDLLDKDVLKHWYSSERLTSSAARSQFLLPDKGR
jgi:hypothetical protein